MRVKLNLISLIFLMILSTTAKTQSITSATPTSAYQGETLEMTITTSSIVKDPINVWKLIGPNIIWGSGYNIATNTYRVSFSITEYEPIGKYKLTLGTDTFSIPVSINKRNFPEEFNFLSVKSIDINIRNLDDVEYDYGIKKIATDKLGNIYCVGKSYGISNFGGQSVKPSGSKNGFVAKYNNKGVLIWVKTIGSALDYNPMNSTESYERITSIKVLNDTVIYVSGAVICDTSLKFNHSKSLTYPAKNNKTLDGILMKLDSSGNLLWYAFQGSAKNDATNDLEIDNKGNVFVTGYLQGDLRSPYYESCYSYIYSSDLKDSIQMKAYSNDMHGLFIAQYSPGGNLIWAKRQDATLSTHGANPKAIKLCSDNSLVILAWTQSALSYENNNCSNASSGNEHYAILKTDSMGNRLWCDEYDNYGNVFTLGLDQWDNIYIQSVFDFRKTAWKKYTPDGRLLLSKKTNSLEIFTSVTSVTDKNGNSYSAFTYRVDDKISVILRKIDSAGNVLAVTYPDPFIYGNYSSPTTLALSKDQSKVYLAGIYKGYQTFGKTTIFSSTPKVFLNELNFYPKPKSEFSVSNACVNWPVSIKNTSSVLKDSLVKYHWDFGNGDTSNQEKPSYKYSKAGQYKISLKVYGSKGGVDTSSQIIHIYSVPKAEFSATDVCLAENVFFKDSSLSGLIWYWDFGDSTYSNEQQPEHRYSLPGTYIVKLTVKNASGCTDTFMQEVIVSDMPKAIFTAHNICLTDNLFLTNSSSGATKWFWSFGDGDTSLLQSPIHRYLSTGEYVVSLTVENTSGCKDSVAQMIIVDSACVWPGDANADKIVNNKDILAIGLAYADTGSSRTDTSSIWKGNILNNWSKNFASGQNYKHADSDGNGTVSALDTSAITRNYSKTHKKNFNTTRGKNTDPVLKVEIQNTVIKAGDVLVAYIVLGENALPAKDVYGVALSLEYNKDYFNKPVVSFTNSWLGNNQLTYYNSTNGLDIALTRTDHNNISGSGRLAEIRMKVKDNARFSQKQLNVGISNMMIISADEKPVPVRIISDTVLVEGVSIDDNFDENRSSSLVNIYPNPFTGQTTIAYNLTTNSKVTISLCDINGKAIQIKPAKQEAAGEHQFVLDAGKYNLPNGVYMLKVDLDGLPLYKKVVKVD